MIKITSIEQLDELIGKNQKEDLFILKHSTNCPLSSVALEVYEDFVQRHPELTCAFIDLIAYRDVSNALAEKSGVRHHSPQVIQYYGGKEVWNTSHQAITQEALERHIHDQTI